MKGLNLLRILLVIPLLALATAAPALAKAPDIMVESWDDTYTWYGWDDNPCGFDILVHDYGKLRTQLFYDQDGKLIRVHEIYGAWKVTYSANGKTLKALLQGPIFWEIISETEVIGKWAGTDALIPIPGYGPGFGAAGNRTFRFQLVDGEWIITEVIKDAGRVHIDDTGPFCEYLGP